jgi:hypothetical protein
MRTSNIVLVVAVATALGACRKTEQKAETSVAPPTTVQATPAPDVGSVVQEMTPERIREAIAESKEPDYSIELETWPFSPVLFNTPYSRVAKAAGEAKKAYRPFTEKSVTAEMAAPHVTFVALPAIPPPVDNPKQEDGQVAAIVVMPVNSDDRTKAVLPLSQETFPAPSGGKAMAATFPISALSKGNEVRVVYAGKVCAEVKSTSKNLADWKLRDECRYPFKLDKVR